MSLVKPTDRHHNFERNMMAEVNIPLHESCYFVVHKLQRLIGELPVHSCKE